MAKTKIEWAEHSWNVVTGCTPVSEGCRHCYAKRMARRLAGRYSYPEYPHHFDVTLHPDRLDVPLRRKKPTTYFVCSMSDLFHEDVPDEFIDLIWATMLLSPQHTYRVLTKRPRRALRYFDPSRADPTFPTGWRYTYILRAANSIRLAHPGLTQIGISDPVHFPPSNCWLGVSIENQATADERIPLLLRTPAAVWYVSVEPMLGAVDLTRIRVSSMEMLDALTGKSTVPHSEPPKYPGLDWVICGGESGPGARPMHPDWAQSLRDQCQAADVPFFFKQWGTWFPRSQWENNPDLILPDDCDCVDGHSLKVIDNDVVHRVGKKAAGRLLDGRTWGEMPKGETR